MDRALGVLLDRGYLPEAGLVELARLSEEAGHSLATAARLLIAETQRP